LTYQRYCSKSIDDQLYHHRIKVAAVSNVAATVGGAVGAGIGAAVAFWLTGGIGTMWGAAIGSFIGAAATSLTVDYLMDKTSHSLVAYEALPEIKVEKKEAYEKSMDFF
jgi:hypothetical protein